LGPKNAEPGIQIQSIQQLSGIPLHHKVKVRQVTPRVAMNAMQQEVSDGTPHKSQPPIASC
jgi:hypothetical protein